jgi:hypothetical protein
VDQTEERVRAELEALNVEFWYRVDHSNRHLATVFQGPEKGVLPFGPPTADGED